MKLIQANPCARFVRTAIFTFSMPLLLSACMVGPNFQKPAAPTTQHYDVQAEQALSASNNDTDARHIDLGKQLEGNWWSQLGSAKLNAVMQKAVTGNFDLQAADATIAQTNEANSSSIGSMRPT